LTPPTYSYFEKGILSQLPNALFHSLVCLLQTNYNSISDQKNFGKLKRFSQKTTLFLQTCCQVKKQVHISYLSDNITIFQDDKQINESTYVALN
jgi:hypothetical protein